MKTLQYRFCEAIRPAMAWLSMLLLLPLGAAGPAQSQVFDRLYADSAPVTLAQPLQWVAVPAGTVATPDDLPDEAKARFQPYTDDTVLPTSGQRDAWATFSLPATAVSQTLFMRIQRQTIQKVSLFSPNPQGGWQVESAGESIAPADWALRTRVPSFELQTHTDQASVYYLRFEHRQPVSERPMLLSPIEYVDGASRVGLVIGLMWGVFGLLTMLCAGAFVLARNRVFLWFGAVVVTLMFAQLVLIGYGGWRMWPRSAHLNQVMGWVMSALSMAAGAWFCAQASYTRTAHPRIYRLLATVTAGSLVLTLLLAIDPDLVPRTLRNLWIALAMLAILFSLVWMSLRGQPWNLLLLLGAAPIGLATLARLSYNTGWASNVEMAQAAGVLSAMTGLMWIFLVLAWRSRAALFSNQRGSALATYDAASGLMLPRVIDTRLPQMLARARRHRSACGVIMLRWLNQAPSHDSASDQQRSARLSRLGEIVRGAARDVDTALRYDENNFMMLIEGPVGRNALSEIATKVLADCIRATERLGEPGAFNLQIAIWHDTPADQSAAQVLEALRTRLHRMASGTKRPVQFVDSAADPDSQPAEGVARRDDLLAKINAIEISHPTLTSERRDR